MATKKRIAWLRDNMPGPEVGRWTASRKAHIVEAVESGAHTLQTVMTIYSLSPDEYLSWSTRYRAHGNRGLKVTRLQQLGRVAA